MEKSGYVLKVYPVRRSREIYRVIEIPDDETLDSLCRAILDAFDFSDEHLYEFCMDNRMYKEYNYQSSPEEGEPSTDIELKKLGLTQGQNFSLHYDFGDDWMFVIHVQKMIANVSEDKPKLVKEKGYLRQYPDWDDEEE